MLNSGGRIGKICSDVAHIAFSRGSQVLARESWVAIYRAFIAVRFLVIGVQEP